MFELARSKNSKEYYFRVKLPDGSIVLTSGGYKSKSSSRDAIRSLALNAMDLAQYDLKKAGPGQYYFNMKAGNGRVLATSKLYSTQSEAESQINALRSKLNLRITDLTD